MSPIIWSPLNHAPQSDFFATLTVTGRSDVTVDIGVAGVQLAWGRAAFVEEFLYHNRCWHFQRATPKAALIGQLRKIHCTKFGAIGAASTISTCSMWIVGWTASNVVGGPVMLVIQHAVQRTFATTEMQWTPSGRISAPSL